MKKSNSIIYSYANRFSIVILTYLVRVTTPGIYCLPPTKVEEMYTPEVFGRSMEKEIVVK